MLNAFIFFSVVVAVVALLSRAGFGFGRVTPGKSKRSIRLVFFLPDMCTCRPSSFCFSAVLHGPEVTTDLKGPATVKDAAHDCDERDFFQMPCCFMAPFLPPYIRVTIGNAVLTGLDGCNSLRQLAAACVSLRQLAFCGSLLQLATVVAPVPCQR